MIYCEYYKLCCGRGNNEVFSEINCLNLRKKEKIDCLNCEYNCDDNFSAEKMSLCIMRRMSGECPRTYEYECPEACKKDDGCCQNLFLSTHIITGDTCEVWEEFDRKGEKYLRVKIDNEYVDHVKKLMIDGTIIIKDEKIVLC